MCLDMFPFGTPGKGYCTKKCTTQVATCSGAPAGTYYYCGLKMESTMYCLFVCGFGSSPTFPCPKTLKCTAFTAKGTTIHLCSP